MRQPLYITAFALLLLISATNTFADSQEEKLRAGYIYNFIRFITWPESSLHEYFILCVISNNNTGNELKALEARSIYNRIIDVRSYPTPANIDDCAVVYLPSSDVRLQLQLINQVRHKQLVTISNGAAFVEMGGMISLESIYSEKKFRQITQLHFSINLDAAEKSGIIISSKLLNLATKVVP